MILGIAFTNPRKCYNHVVLLERAVHVRNFPVIIKAQPFELMKNQCSLHRRVVFTYHTGQRHPLLILAMDDYQNVS